MTAPAWSPDQPKPCPFCGGEARPNTVTYSASMVREQGWPQATWHSVNCIMCGADIRGSMTGWETPELAIAQWNRRAWRADAEPTPSYDARELAERYIYLRYGSQHGGSPRQDDYAFEGPSAIRDFVAYAVTFWGVPASGDPT